jgi:transmembrane protein
MLLLGDLTMEEPAPSSTQRETPTVIAHILDSGVTLFVARVWVVLPFLVSGLTKCLDWQAGEHEMARAGLHPTWAFNLAALLTEVLGSVSVVLNRQLWLGAGALGVFTVLTNFIAHRYWEFGGDERVAQLNSFLEHWTMSAAFILIVVVYLRDRPKTAR